MTMTAMTQALIAFLQNRAPGLSGHFELLALWCSSGHKGTPSLRFDERQGAVAAIGRAARGITVGTT